MPSLLEVAASNLAPAQGAPARRTRATINAAKVCADLWAMAEDVRELGRFPRQAEHAARWGITERQVQRIWARFEAAFPGETSPERMAVWLAERIEEHSVQNEAQAATLPAPVAVAA